MYSKKYKLDKIEEFKRHDPIYDGMEECTCYLAYLKVGERGWFLWEEKDWANCPHGIHTTTVKDIDYTRSNQVIVTTQNTRFTFSVIEGE